MMSESEKTHVNAMQVLGYLRENPDFLLKHPDLLNILAPPSRWEGGNGGNVVDIQTSMLDRMRDESTDLKDAANLLISTTRSNIMVQTRTIAAVIAILSADNLERLVHLVCNDFILLLDIDSASLCLETGAKNLPDIDEIKIRRVPVGTVNKILGGSEELIQLIEHSKDDGVVFGQNAGLVKSAAFSRLQLGFDIPTGLLALGSHKKGAFHSGQGTDLFIFLTQVLELTLHKWLAKE